MLPPMMAGRCVAEGTCRSWRLQQSRHRARAAGLGDARTAVERSLLLLVLRSLARMPLLSRAAGLGLRVRAAAQRQRGPGVRGA